MEYKSLEFRRRVQANEISKGVVAIEKNGAPRTEAWYTPMIGGLEEKESQRKLRRSSTSQSKARFTGNRQMFTLTRKDGVLGSFCPMSSLLVISFIPMSTAYSSPRKWLQNQCFYSDLGTSLPGNVYPTGVPAQHVPNKTVLNLYTDAVIYRETCLDHLP